ncbi:MAG: acyl carrier protein [Ruminiclostridium sp.]|nr:acyl carrier protein [Ruminiclostridium sp.]
MDNIYKRLTQVFRDYFDDDSIEIDEDTTADDIDDWDSLSHITLMSAIEDEFGVKFTMGEVSGMENVGEMAEIIKARGTKLG